MQLNARAVSLQQRLSLRCNGWQVQHRKLQASKVLANYQCSPLPCEMWSVWDDNMAIHYSLELGASCRSMGRTWKPNSGILALSQNYLESSGGRTAGEGWVTDSRRTHFKNSFLMLMFRLLISVHLCHSDIKFTHQSYYAAGYSKDGWSLIYLIFPVVFSYLHHTGWLWCEGTIEGCLWMYIC